MPSQAQVATARAVLQHFGSFFVEVHIEIEALDRFSQCPAKCRPQKFVLPREINSVTVPASERLFWVDNLTAAKVNGLDPGSIPSSFLHSCAGALLQGVLQQKVGRLDVTMDCIGIMAYCNCLQGYHSCMSAISVTTSEWQFCDALICSR